jgi:hypothetical protein
MNKNITLVRACKATIIPAGDEVTLTEGANFTIAQSLGGSVTLRDNTGMYRVGEAELDALGEEIKQEMLRIRDPSARRKYGMQCVGVMTRKYRLILST